MTTYEKHNLILQDLIDSSNSIKGDSQNRMRRQDIAGVASLFLEQTKKRKAWLLGILQKFIYHQKK